MKFESVKVDKRVQWRTTLGAVYGLELQKQVSKFAANFHEPAAFW